jgi:hypothetical protein
MGKPPFFTRMVIIVFILCVIPITATHFGAIYLGKENGILFGFCVGIPCVSFSCWKLFIDSWREGDDE